MYLGIWNMIGYVRYRTVVQCEFYAPLVKFKVSKHLTEIVYDVLLGMSVLLISRHSIIHPSLDSNRRSLREESSSRRHQRWQHHDRR